MAKYKHVVTPEEVGRTINQILRINFNFSARFRTKIKYQSLIDLNGVQTPGFIVPETGDIISVRLPEEHSDLAPEAIPIDVIYEDEDLLVINKQSDIIVHPTKGHLEHTLANGIVKYMTDKGQSYKVRFVNRIDMDTTGIVVVAKNSNAHSDLAAQMRHGNVKKKYLALCEGSINIYNLGDISGVSLIEDDAFMIDIPIGRPFEDSIMRAYLPIDEGGKEAISEVRVRGRYTDEDLRDYTLSEVILHSGRTHQIRVHMSYIGHPITGDALYGGHEYIIARQALHAHYIEFDHPMDHKRISFEAKLPADLSDIISEII